MSPAEKVALSTLLSLVPMAILAWFFIIKAPKTVSTSSTTVIIGNAYEENVIQRVLARFGSSLDPVYFIREYQLKGLTLLDILVVAATTRDADVPAALRKFVDQMMKAPPKKPS